MPPETPQVGLRALLLGGGGNRDDVVITRIQRASDAADSAALAGCIVAFEQDDYGNVLELWAARQQCELALVFFQLGLKVFLVNFLAEIQRLQNISRSIEGSGGGAEISVIFLPASSRRLRMASRMTLPTVRLR